MGIGKGTGKGGARPGTGPKPRAAKMVTVGLYLTENENEAVHLLAHEQGKSLSRYVGELITQAYTQRVIKGE